MENAIVYLTEWNDLSALHLQLGDLRGSPRLCRCHLALGVLGLFKFRPHSIYPFPCSSPRVKCMPYVDVVLVSLPLSSGRVSFKSISLIRYSEHVYIYHDVP